MMVEQDLNRGEILCDMSAENRKLYSTLNQVNQQKVIDLIATLLNQQSNDLQSSDSQM